MAQQREWTLAQFALNWVLSNRIITSAILGVSRPEQIADALKHINESLTAEELTEVNRISKI